MNCRSGRHCGTNRLVFKLVSEPCGTAAGDCGVGSSDRRPAALCETAQADKSGSSPVGLALHRLAGVEVRGVHHQAVDGCRMASKGLSPVLDLEDPTRQGGPSSLAERRSRTDPYDEPRKSALGRSEDPW